MTECDRLSDRMPLVGQGRSSWTAEEQQHLSGCAECRAEWELIGMVGRIGARAPRPGAAPTFDGRLLARLAEPLPALSRRRVLRWAVGLAVAAGVALAVWTGTPRRSPMSTAAAVPAADSGAPPDSTDFGPLLDDDLPPAGWSMLDTPGLGDLNAEELELVLRTWEG